MADIAIIGMAARLPGASTVAAFWSNLCAGVDSMRDISDEELYQSGMNPSVWNRENYVRKAAFPEDVELFDAHFFGLTPGEATIIDPQHRLLLECAHEALEDAGQDPDRFAGPIAVFAGCALNTYLLTHLMSYPDLLHTIDPVQLNIASSPDFLATRISYKLGLRGISHTVQCACSTSLVAVHLACQSLLAGESDMALAGGAALNFHLRYGYAHTAGGMFSARGTCRVFDSEADGTVFGNGAGIVVLKRYEDAARDRDQIYAIIKGSAVNNDGAAKVGFTAPSVEGQSLVIAEAMSNAGILPDDVGYVEAHGTGTPLGDPIEMEALARAYQTTTAHGRCLIGSVKSNIGHLDCAAGVAGLIKTAHILKHSLIPPSLRFKTPNPHIVFDGTPFQVNTELTAWPDSRPRRVASVSAFGVGGTNAHVVLEAANRGGSDRPVEPFHLLIHSAISESALDEKVRVTNAHPIVQHSATLGDAAFTLATGRRQFPWRHAEVITTHAGSGFDLLAAHRSTHNAPATPPPVIFMFPGQGSQTLFMGEELYRTEPVFRAAIDTCFDRLGQCMDLNPRTLTHLSNAPAESERLLQETEYAQPLLFAFEYSLAQLWISWGVKPSLMIGHSLGEYVAGCIGGTFTLEEALKLIVFRGRLMQTTQPGAMLSVPLGLIEATSLRDEITSLAAVNGPSQCVFSGSEDAIHTLHQRLETEGIHARRLSVSRAFHSSLMDPILESFRAYLQTISLAPPQIPWMSNLTGGTITAEQAMDPAYWVDHLRNTVRFYENIRDAHGLSDAVFLEVGPQRVLQQMASRLPLSTKNQIAISSVGSEKTEYVSVLSTLGALWVRGVQVDWNAVYDKKDRVRTSLPTYPFERQRCWVERPAPTAVNPSERPGLHVETTTMPGSKASIPTTLHNRPRLSTPYLAPSTPTQIRLVSILESAFGIRPLGIRDNFFALGADSLMAIALVSQLKDHYGVQLTAVHLYEALDIISLAAIIDEMVAESLQVATL